MPYRATQQVVQRVMPLLERISTRTLDKARLLQYLSARAGIDWGVLDLVAETDDGNAGLGGSGRVLTVRDGVSGEEHEIRYPTCLPIELEPLVREEYKRLAVDQPLTMMDESLFQHFFRADFCDRCRWRDPRFAQFHRECRFAGHPINFEPE